MHDQKQVFLPKKVRELIATHLVNDSMSTADMLAIADVLKFAESPEETEVFLAGLGLLYPAIAEYEQYKSGLSHIAFEKTVQAMIPKLIVKNPALATRVMRTAQTPGMTMEKLLEEFPELQTIA